MLENFNRVVFESVVEKIIVGGYNDEGVEDTNHNHFGKLITYASGKLIGGIYDDCFLVKQY